MHQGVAVAAAFEDAGFDAIGAVGDFAVREMFEKLAARGGGLCVARGGIGPVGPRGHDVVARAGEADLAGL